LRQFIEIKGDGIKNILTLKIKVLLLILVNSIKGSYEPEIKKLKEGVS
jgi:hypothetical protein